MWLTVKEVAELFDTSDRTIQRRIKDFCEGEKYVFRCSKGKGRGGKQYEILLESLPQWAQDKYNGVGTNDYISDNEAYKRLGKKRDKAIIKYNIVCAYLRYKKENHFKGKQQAFIAKHNEEHPDNTITKRQLEYWCRCYMNGGLLALADNRGGQEGKTRITEDMWDVFKKLYLRESRPSIMACYEITQEHFAEQGITIPSYSSFKIRVRKIPEIVVARYRHGKKYYEDKYLPYIPQDYSDTYSNQLWIGDHHLFDVLVVDEEGNVFRPWLSAWEDLHSRMLVGYVVNRISPNSDIVLDSFARGCYTHGIPDEIKIDNGKDYKTYDLFNSGFALSICNTMNIGVTNALPFNAKAKPIERLFRTLEEKYCKFLDSYIGNSPHNRPEDMRKLNKKLKNKAMPYKDFLKFVDNMIKTYNSSYHSAIKATPIDAYKSGFAKPMRYVADEDILNAFFMRTTKPIKVSRNGIRVPAIGYYYDDTRLAPYIGKEVYARYNADDIRKIYVFDENNDLICSAKSVEISSHKSPVTMEYIKELQHKKKAKNKFVREHLETDITIPSVDEYVNKKSDRFEDVSTKGNVIQLTPVTYAQAEKMKQEDENENINTAAEKVPKKENIFNSREADKRIAEFYKQAGGI